MVDDRRRHGFECVSIRTSLPKLAWSIALSPGGACLDAGAGVEVGEGVCFEGAWSQIDCDLRAQYEAGRLDGTYFFGSAVLRTDERRYVFFPPTHTLDALYVLVWNNQSGVTVTNSFVWAVRQSGVSLDNISFNQVASDLLTSNSGLLGYKRHLFSTKTCSVLRIMFTPFVVDVDGSFQEWPLALPSRREQFTYEEYRNGLLGVLDATWRNASSEERKHPFRKFASTMSSGYDSVACTALLKPLGFRSALSLKTARGQRDDSGVLAGTEMGVDVRLFDRIGDGLEYQGANGSYYLKLGTLRASSGRSFAEFIAPLTCHGDIVFEAFEPELSSSVLLTGFLGDYVWDYNCLVGPWVKKGEPTGAALNEFRLRVGFIHVPVPYILCREWRAIKWLTQSREMRPFSYGNPYNRPIARRLGEEAGASRESFGVKKKAALVMLVLDKGDLASSVEEISARYD